MSLFICPVCGWKGLEEKPTYPYSSHEICACCGTQFGLDIVSNNDIKNVRNEWISDGALWFDGDERPSVWNLQVALKQIEDFESKHLE